MSWIEYKWIAKDEDGKWYAFQRRPVKKNTVWGDVSPSEIKLLKGKAFNINWKQSLRRVTEADREWIEGS